MAEDYSVALARALVQDASKGRTGAERVLRRISSTHVKVARFLTGEAAAVALAVAKAVALAADLAKAGADPVKEIQRIRNAEPLLEDMRAKWAARKKKKLES